MRERLERVVSEAQLRPGLLVEVHPCVDCGKNERLLLLRRGDFNSECPGCGATTAWDWTGNGCIGSADVHYMCLCGAIPGGRLYIVDPWSEIETPARTEKRLERTK